MTLVQSKAHLAIAHMQQMQARMHTMQSCTAWRYLMNNTFAQEGRSLNFIAFELVKHTAVLHAHMAAGSIAWSGCREACLEVSASECVQTDIVHHPGIRSLSAQI